MAASQVAFVVKEHRREHRDEVHHHVRVIAPGGRQTPALLVNLSPGGAMARCEAPCRSGDRLQFRLPVVGMIDATVRWALGGRFGCQFDSSISAPDYPAVLAEMGRD